MNVSVSSDQMKYWVCVELLGAIWQIGPCNKRVEAQSVLRRIYNGGRGSDGQFLFHGGLAYIVRAKRPWADRVLSPQEVI